MDSPDRNVLTQHHQEAFDLPPFTETDRIAHFAKMAAARRGLIHGEHPILAEKILGLSEARAIGDVK